MRIELRNVTLSYRVPFAGKRSLKDALISLFKGRPAFELRTAVRDISFNAEAGDIIGVIGKNGAGKSSLLKLIAGVIPPTNGSVFTKGRVSAMIELGAGFHPELTALENIVIYGTMLGLDSTNLKMNSNEILEYAGLAGRGNDPIRTFSSGMLARLGFAVSTIGNPDILLIDEVLAVGDQDFQLKSRTRMNELLNSGKIIVLVSHDLDTVQQICNKVIHLEKGEVVNFGVPNEVIEYYSKSNG